MRALQALKNTLRRARKQITPLVLVRGCVKSVMKHKFRNGKINKKLQNGRFKAKEKAFRQFLLCG